MTRDPRYDMLFEPLRIGTGTMRNGFYHGSHYTGWNRASPVTLAVTREVEAGGGWGVVCTAYPRDLVDLSAAERGTT